MVSGIAKMFPIWAFEKQLVDLDFASWCSAPYFSRFIIAIEIALALAILQNHFIKKIIIPVTILLLLVFNVHLAVEMYKHGAMNGNCGCFGQLISMTPLEAFIKNIVTIGLLIYLYRNVTEKELGQNKAVYLITFYLASALFMFVVFPFCPCPDETKSELNSNQISEIQIDTTPIINSEVPLRDDTLQKDNSKENVKKVQKEILKEALKPIKLIETGPKKVTSKFSKYANFGGVKMNLDEGKKILCLFAAGCDHCRETAKAIAKMSKKEGFPEVAILFMDEEVELIPDFFKFSQKEFPYQVIKIPEFWQVIGNDSNTPGVVYLWNGNILKFYEGTEGNKFIADDLKKAIEGK